MKLTEMFLEELEAEAPATRRALERVPDGHPDWKPHAKSMQMGYLATLVATIPSWVTMAIKQDELDLHPVGKPSPTPPIMATGRELVQAFDKAVAEARDALKGTSDEHLRTSWRLLVAGTVVMEQPRYVVIRDSALNHMVHHRGQLTVYLRLNEVAVPSVYGPTADEKAF